MGINKTNSPIKTNQKKRKGTRSLWASATTVVRLGIRLQIAGNRRLIKRRPKNWKKKGKKEVGASNVEVLLLCTKTRLIKYENCEVLFEIDLLELALQKLEEILVPSNPPDDNKNGMGNENSTGGT